MKKPSAMFVMAMFTLLVGAGFLTPVATGQSNETSILEVTEPLDVGGTIIQPGTYRIKVVPLLENRNMLQVRSEDLTKVVATVLSINHPRVEGRPDTHYVYYPAVAGLPKALRTWYPANVGSGGHDVVYPHDRAIELASRVNEPVPAYEAAGPVPEEQMKTIEVKPVYETKTAIAEAPVPPPPPPVRLAENKLPRTASELPLVAGLGLLALGGAASLRLIGRRIV